jgi:DNA ligase-associated metallophosphoesterase
MAEAASAPRQLNPFIDAGGGLGLDLLVNGTPVVLRASGALWHPGTSSLVVADLHLEKASAYAARGQLLPPYDTRETLQRLGQEIARLRPARLVFLGDSFHDNRARTRMAGEDLALLEATTAGLDTVWIAGNHDRDGLAGLAGDIADVLHLDSLTLRHEPLPGLQPGEVSGHLHPVARVAGRGRAVRRRCFATDGSRLVMPAFGAYAGGLNLLDKAWRGLFSRQLFAAVLGVERVLCISLPDLIGD